MPPIINSLDAFFEAMVQLYDDPQWVAAAETALHTLQQGRQLVEDYMVDFHKWFADTGWNEAALRYQYHQGLSKSLKDELARHKKQHLTVCLADSSIPCSGSVTYATTPLLVSTESGHQKFLRLDILYSPMFPVILGIPWLQAHPRG